MDMLAFLRSVTSDSAFFDMLIPYCLKQLTDAGREAFSVDKVAPTLIVVILPEGNTQIYNAVKQCV